MPPCWGIWSIHQNTHGSYQESLSDDTYLLVGEGVNRICRRLRGGLLPSVGGRDIVSEGGAAALEAHACAGSMGELHVALGSVSSCSASVVGEGGVGIQRRTRRYLEMRSGRYEARRGW